MRSISAVALLFGSLVAVTGSGRSSAATLSLPDDPVVASVAEVVASPVRPADLLGFACSTSSTCVLATEPSVVTEDLGATWRTLPTPRFTAVGCTLLTTCVATADFGSHVSSDGGLTWTNGGALPGFTGRAIACPTAQRCIAGGARQVGTDLSASIAVTDDGGLTWTFRYTATEPSGFVRVECASSTFCVASAFGVVVATTDGGGTWSALPGGLGSPLTNVAIGCRAPSMCFALASSNMLRSDDGGATWTPGANPLGTAVPNSIGCLLTTRCVGVGANGSFTFDVIGGTSSPVAYPPGVGAISHVRCQGTVCVSFGAPSPGKNYAAGAFSTRVAVASGDGLNTWVRVGPAPAVTSVRALACADALACVAVGDVDELTPTARLAPAVRRSTDAGGSWSAGGVPTEIEQLSDVACVPDGGCVAAGRLASNATLSGLARTVDGGLNWFPSTVDVGVASIASLSCFSGGTCIALADEAVGAQSDWPRVVLRSTNAGARWTAVSSFGPSLVSMHCLDALQCLALVTPRSLGAAPTLRRSFDGGSTWSPVALPEPVAGAVSLAGCTSNRCFLGQTGGDGITRWYRSETAGTSWTLMTTSPFGDSSGDLGCSGSLCVVAGASSLGVSRDGGQNWTLSLPVPWTAGAIASTTCLSSTRCLGVTAGSSLGGPGVVAVSLTIPTVRSTVAVTPARLLESRIGRGLTTVDGLHQGVGRLQGGNTYVLPVTGRGVVPADAASALLNVTATGAAAPGFLTVHPCDRPRPVASSLNYTANAAIANGVVAKLSATGTTCVYTSADTDVVVDVGGYVLEDVAAPVGLVPARLLDTRSGPGLVTADRLHEGVGPIAAGTTYELPVVRRAGVGPDAATAILNVAVTGPSAPGFLTVYPCDEGRPNASTLNYSTGTTIANSVFAKLSVTGSVCLFSSATTDVVVDVNGSVRALPGAPVGVAPARLWETRAEQGLTTVDGMHQGTGRQPGGESYQLPVRGRGNVANDASSVFVNIAAVAPGAPGFVTVYPCDGDRPNASSLNFGGGTTIANMVVAKVSAAGTICVFNSAPTDVIVDVVAYV